MNNALKAKFTGEPDSARGQVAKSRAICKMRGDAPGGQMYLVRPLVMPLASRLKA